jgi:hypothetical protein
MSILASQNFKFILILKIFQERFDCAATYVAGTFATNQQRIDTFGEHMGLVEKRGIESSPYCEP